MYFPFVLKELSKRKSRTLTNILTIVTVVIILLLVSGIMNAYGTAIYQPFDSINSDLILQKSENTSKISNSQIRIPFGKAQFTGEEIEKISALDHVQSISSSLILWDFNKKGFISIEGLEPNSKIYSSRESQLYKGRFLKSDDENKVVVEKHFAKFNHLIVGSNISLGDELFEVVGTLANDDNSQIFSSNVYLNINEAHNLMGNDGFNQIYLKIDELSNEEDLKFQIKKIDENITTISSSSISATLSNTINIFRKFQYLGITIILFITVLVLLKVNSLNILERRKDIAVMKTVGWTKKAITKQLLSEFIIQTIIGFVIGIILSKLIVLAIGTIQFNISSGLESSIISFNVSLPAIMIIKYLSILAITSLITVYFVVKKISSMKPSENLRSY
jgi:lipoprotein-releasing system permease protein